MREGDAPSYFNPLEAGALVDLVAGLLVQHAGSSLGVVAADIGVIATYRKQAGHRLAPSVLNRNRVLLLAFPAAGAARGQQLRRRRGRHRRHCNLQEAGALLMHSKVCWLELSSRE